MIEPGLSAKPKMIANIEPPDGSFFCRDRLYAELLHAFRLMVATPDLLLEFVLRMGASVGVHHSAHAQRSLQRGGEVLAKMPLT
jgi:hypothetical protein